MRSFSVAVVALVAAIVLSADRNTPAHAGEGDALYAVVNARNPTKKLSRTQVRNLYLGKVSFWQGVVPVKLTSRPAKSTAGKQFFAWLGVKHQQFDSYWSSRQLSGRGVKPPSVTSASSLVQKIRSAPGAIGFGLKTELLGVTNRSGVRFIRLK